MPFQVLEAEAKSILSATTGFIAEAGFTHSLTPARNCTFGCTYCYVPTMGIYGGLKPEDWRHWGQFTTFKTNAPELLRRQLRADQVIYCSPLVDPYQPAEESEQLMPRVFDELTAHPPRIFVIQTRGPLIVRDLGTVAGIIAAHHAARQFFAHHQSRGRPQAVRAALRDARLPPEGDSRFARRQESRPSRRSRRCCRVIPRNWLGLRWKQQTRTSSAMRCMSDPSSRAAPPRATLRSRSAGSTGLSDWLDAEFQAEMAERIGRVVRQCGAAIRHGAGGISMAHTITAHSVLDRLGIRLGTIPRSAVASLNPSQRQRTCASSPGLGGRLRSHRRTEHRGIRALAHVPCPQARRNRARNRRRAAARQRRPRHAGHARNWARSSPKAKAKCRR